MTHQSALNSKKRRATAHVNKGISCVYARLTPVMIKRTDGGAYACRHFRAVPIAVSAFSGRQLEALHFKNLDSIATSIPNVQLDSLGAMKNTAAFSIRG